MSNKTISLEYRIKRISEKLAHLVDKLKASGDMPYKYRHNIKRQIVGKKQTLRYLSKLYIWGVK